MGESSSFSPLPDFIEVGRWGGGGVGVGEWVGINSL